MRWLRWLGSLILFMFAALVVLIAGQHFLRENTAGFRWFEGILLSLMLVGSFVYYIWLNPLWSSHWDKKRQPEDELEERYTTRALVSAALVGIGGFVLGFVLPIAMLIATYNGYVSATTTLNWMPVLSGILATLVVGVLCRYRAGVRTAVWWILIAASFVPPWHVIFGTPVVARMLMGIPADKIDPPGLHWLLLPGVATVLCGLAHRRRRTTGISNER